MDNIVKMLLFPNWWRYRPERSRRCIYPHGLLPSLISYVFYILTKWMGARSRMDGWDETNAEELIHVFLAELQVHMILLVC